jgi:hypothetical protein
VAVAYLLITEGTGAKMDTRTVGASVDRHRQVLVIGDPTTDTEVAPVTQLYGLGADVKRVPADPFGANADAQVGTGTGSINAHLRGGNTLMNTWLPYLASLDAEMSGVYSTLGFGADAAAGDAVGSVNSHARGIVKALGTNADAAVTAGAAGSVDALLRSISRDLILTAPGGLYAGTTALTPKFASISASTNGDNTLVAAVGGKKIRVLSLALVSAGTVSARLQTAAAGAYLTGALPLVANSGFVLPFSPTGWAETVAGDLLNLELSAGVAVGGLLCYAEV